MRVLIVGAGYAGLEAALRLSRKDRTISVTLVSAAAHFRERIRDHQWAVGARPRLVSLEDFLRGTGVRLVLGRVRSVDRAGRTARVTPLLGGQSGTELELPWDYLILATGSVTDARVDGVSQHACTLDGLGSERIATELSRLGERGGTVVVVGGGLSGIEAAAEIAESYPRLRVELVARGAVGEGFSPAARAAFERCFQRLGVQARPYREVTCVGSGHLLLSTGELAFDLCVWVAGFRAGQLPQGLDLPLDPEGRVLVSCGLSAIDDPRVFAAGDCAAYPSHGGRAIPSGCKSAGPAGKVVADNVLRSLRGGALAPFRFATPLYCVSLGRKDGVVQRTAPDGSLSGWVVSGRLGALIKELICRATLWAFALERKPTLRYASRKPSLLPARQAEENAR